jgi:shikimate dehydrogenase
MQPLNGGKQRLNVNSDTLIYGVFGDPVRHSRSPVMLSTAFAQTGINAVYVAFHVRPDQLGDAVRGVRSLGIRGVNVTIPHKVEVMNYLDAIDETAKIAGAVNTIVNRDGNLTGYNTDGIGYVRSLQEETGFALKNSRILLLGAGGAARGVAHALAREVPSHIFITNRTPSKALQLAAELEYVSSEVVPWEQVEEMIDKVDVVINTTPIGMSPRIDEMPIDPRKIQPGAVVSDLIYNPLITTLLQQAKSYGAKIHGGLGMFIYQGAFAFEYWTGYGAPVDAMRQTVLETFISQGSAKP